MFLVIPYSLVRDRTGEARLVLAREAKARYGMSEDTLFAGLRELVRAGLISVRGGPSNAYALGDAHEKSTSLTSNASRRTLG